MRKPNLSVKNHLTGPGMTLNRQGSYCRGWSMMNQWSFMEMKKITILLSDDDNDNDNDLI